MDSQYQLCWTRAPCGNLLVQASTEAASFPTKIEVPDYNVANGQDVGLYYGTNLDMLIDDFIYM